jgi:hypothetical protein
MKQRFLGLSTLAMALTLVSGAALAEAPSALVSVRAGSGEVQIGSTTLGAGQSAGANAGDAITVTNGSAVVTFANGCTVPVTGSYTVPAQAPTTCANDAKPRKHVPTSSIVVGVGVAAAVAGAASGGGGGSDKPSSP